MTSIILQAIGAISIICLFLVCYAVAIKPTIFDAISWLKDGLRKQPQHQAVIIPFARPSRRGGRNA